MSMIGGTSVHETAAQLRCRAPWCQVCRPAWCSTCSDLPRVQIMRQYPDLAKRLLATFKSYLEAELKDNPAVADNKQWQKVYQNVKEREEKARQVWHLALCFSHTPEVLALGWLRAQHWLHPECERGAGCVGGRCRAADTACTHHAAASAFCSCFSWSWERGGMHRFQGQVQQDHDSGKALGDGQGVAAGGHTSPTALCHCTGCGPMQGARRVPSLQGWQLSLSTGQWHTVPCAQSKEAAEPAERARMPQSHITAGSQCSACMASRPQPP